MFNGYRVSFLQDEFWRCMVVMVTQNMEVLNATELYT